MEEMSDNTPEPTATGAPPPAAPAQAQAAPASYPPPSYVPPPAAQKTPVLAAMLSFVPGLGNIYNGLYLRGISFFLIFVGLLSLGIGAATEGDERDAAFIFPSMAFFWLFNLFDAYRQASLINSGHAADLGLRDRPKVGTGALVPGVVLFVLGFYGLLSRYFDFDLSFIFEQWPVVLMLFGAFLVIQAYRQRRAAAAPAAYEADDGL